MRTLADRLREISEIDAMKATIHRNWFREDEPTKTLSALFVEAAAAIEALEKWKADHPCSCEFSDGPDNIETIRYCFFHQAQADALSALRSEVLAAVDLTNGVVDVDAMVALANRLSRAQSDGDSDGA